MARHIEGPRPKTQRQWIRDIADNSVKVAATRSLLIDGFFQTFGVERSLCFHSVLHGTKMPTSVTFAVKRLVFE